jgi:3-deoxy-D-manno-octulosonate 8-phosphate phosphatase (KDO 8-P phosphatase)
MELDERAKRVRLILLDVDGVLTDGGLYYGPQGEVMKRFEVKDGHGIVMWRTCGMRTGILTARSSEIVAVRAKELRLDPVLQGQKNKLAGFHKVLELTSLTAEQVCYVGDDTNDLAVLESVGMAVAPADAVPEARAVAHYVTRAGGGRGAVRELVELLLRAQGQWERALELMKQPPP